MAYENREKAMSLFPCESDEERENLEIYLSNMNVILHVTNTIGEIKVQAFSQFVNKAHKHILEAFGHLQHVKNSVHWTLAHLCELVRLNKGYTLAEYSENSLENMIKKYRNVTQNLSRGTSFIDNTEDCLKNLFAQSLYKIRQHGKCMPKKKEEPLKNDPESILIRSFFKNIDSETGEIIKWKIPGLEPIQDLPQFEDIL